MSVSAITVQAKQVERLEAEKAILREALKTFVKQWNACGPNSDFGRYFENVRDVAVNALIRTNDGARR